MSLEKEIYTLSEQIAILNGHLDYLCGLEKQDRGTPVSAPKPDPKPTFEQVRVVALAMTKRNRQLELTAILNTFGASRLSELAEQDYTAFLVECADVD
jgi:hypothetical protein